MRRRRRRHLGAPEPMEGILERAGEDRFSRVRPPFPSSKWVQAVGPRIADRTRPLRLEGGELLVLVATSVWSSELTMLAADVVARLSALGVGVARLRFRVGAVELERPPERRARRKVPAAVALPAALERVVRSLEDDELMGAIRRAAETNLAWQTGRETGPSRESSAPVAPSLPAFEGGNDRPARATTSDPESGPRSRAGGRGRPP